MASSHEAVLHAADCKCVAPPACHGPLFDPEALPGSGGGGLRSDQVSGSGREGAKCMQTPDTHTHTTRVARGARRKGSAEWIVGPSGVSEGQEGRGDKAK